MSLVESRDRHCDGDLKTTEIYTTFSISREKSRGLELGYRSAGIENTVGDFDFMPPKYSYFYPLR